MIQLWRALTILLGLASITSAQAQSFPNRPIKLIVPFAAGGTTDSVARILAEGLRERLGTIIVENRAGAGGLIGIEAVAGAQADGYTLLYGSDSLIIQPLLKKNLAVSAQSFVPLVRVRASNTYFAVGTDVPVKSVAELVALAKSKPGQLRYGSGGAGTVLHLAGELFKIKTGTDIIHIPYKSDALAATDVMTGQIEAVIAGATTLTALTGKLRILAMTGDKRSKALPDVPTMGEAGFPDVVVTNWNGVLAPAGTPPEIVAKLTQAISDVASSPQFLERGKALEVEPGAVLKGDEFAAFIAKTTANYREIISHPGFSIPE
jgi:tripartite-type tricarboxylate transporter receptor subunit TctC